MKTTSYILLNKKKKTSNYHQITHLICFSVLIINFADINNFPYQVKSSQIYSLNPLKQWQHEEQSSLII